MAFFVSNMYLYSEIICNHIHIWLQIWLSKNTIYNYDFYMEIISKIGMNTSSKDISISLTIPSSEIQNVWDLSFKQQKEGVENPFSLKAH